MTKLFKYFIITLFFFNTALAFSDEKSAYSIIFQSISINIDKNDNLKDYYRLEYYFNDQYVSFNNGKFSRNNADFFGDYYLTPSNIGLMEFKKKENVFRRMEILFFGSLTIVSFAGWLSFSIFNIVIYGDTFGIIRKEQFLPLYLGSSVVSLSVSVSDLLINIKNNKKIVEFY
ncbi:MAG TPA: hypothetical protein PK385_05020 [Spirochaetota bacterium]|nr:hypothetical protein [Spirochaetota bacterium]HOS32060.1 hypothetical protein [Spirochaetota bacterium]HOS55401.1 hypothetical protein [Spirochaetota bacterium]HPK61489.1 hypothetical protein [Spirochaetota bacterium]HQF76849.1 hypothetical protein [Spirochaetota bacterium]